MLNKLLDRTVSVTMIVLLLLVLVMTDVLGNPLYAATEFVFDKLFIFAEWGSALSVSLFY